MVEVRINRTFIDHIALEFIDQIEQNTVFSFTSFRLLKDGALVVLNAEVQLLLSINPVCNLLVEAILQVGDVGVVAVNLTLQVSVRIGASSCLSINV